MISFFLKLKAKPFVIFLISLPLYAFGLFVTVYSNFIQSDNIKYFTSLFNTIFGGTLNVWFNGLTFMSLGVAIWFYKPRIDHMHSAIVLTVAMLLFFVEHILLINYGVGSTLTTSISLLFLIPVLFYFLLAVNIDKDTCIIRNLSILLFFSHTAFNLLVYQFIKHIGLLSTILWSPIRFLAVFAISLVFSYSIIKMGKFKYLGWFKKIY